MRQAADASRTRRCLVRIRLKGSIASGGGQGVGPYGSAAPPKPDVKRRAQHRMRRENESRRLGSTQVVARDFLDKFDDASPQAWLLYPHERLCEREPVGRGEEVGHIGGRRRLSNSRGLPR